MNGPEYDVDRALRHQVEHLNDAPLTLDDIRGRATGIRRRRRIAAGVSAAAVVAIVAPLGFVLADRAPESLPPADRPSPTLLTPSPSPTTGETPSAPTTPVVYDIDTTPPAEGTTGAEIGLPYWFDGQVSLPAGETLTSKDRVYDVVRDPDTGHLLGFTFAQGEYQLEEFGPDGTVLSSAPATSNRIAVAPDGATYAYVTQVGGTWQLVEKGAHSGTWDLGATTPEQGTGATGLLSDGSVVFETRVGRPMLASPDGSTRRIPGTFLTVVGSSAVTDRIAAQTSYNNDGTSCWAVIDTAGKSVAETCDHALGEFSPDGRYVYGFPSDSDGLGPTSVSILDATTLEPVATFAMPNGGFLATPLAWRGDTLVANAWHDSTWYVEFLGVDGVLQLRSSFPGPNNFDPPPFEFGAGPLAGPTG